MLTRRSFITSTAGGALVVVLAGRGTDAAARVVSVDDDGGTGILPATDIPQFRTPLPRPGTMRPVRTVRTPDGLADRYDVAVRQTTQQMLPPGLPRTTIWAYGPAHGSDADFTTPSSSIETRRGRAVQVRWSNELVDDAGKALPHLLPVDPTLHWANPERRPGHMGATTDSKPDFHGLTYVPPEDFRDPATQYTAYQGPVPLVAHLHGAVGVGDESDGYPEAWVLPAARDIPAGYARHGRWYEFFARKAATRLGLAWAPGTQVSHYPNRNRPSALWFHDHALGLTRLNVYAGPVGFFLVREAGPQDRPVDGRTGRPAVLPGDPASAHLGGEIPLAVQDRTFRRDGSLFYPDTRAFFDDYEGPFEPQTPVPPIWNPEFFGSTIVVNGVTWPTARLERRRYRLRLLNGCGSRVLVLDLGGIPGARAWQIGNDGGYLPAPVDLRAQDGHLVLAPAERADVVLDLTDVPEGRHVLRNLGPDSPYKGQPVGELEPADPRTTGRVMELDVVARQGEDRSTPPEHLVLPALPDVGRPVRTRRVALAEHAHDLGGEVGSAPVMAQLGRLVKDGSGWRVEAQSWMDPITENPAAGTTETWEVYNFTEDAHPVHVHEVAFEVTGRAPFELVDGRLEVGATEPPLPGERGRKDTVVAAPGQVTRITARFGTAGQYVWHCHVLEHEDNEMMRPYRTGPRQPGQPD